MKTLLALLLLVLGSRIADAGTITGTSTTFDSEIRQRLVDYGDWAVWNAPSLTANLKKNVGSINYTLARSPDYISDPLSTSPAAAIFYTGEGYYTGGLSYTASNVDGKGFMLTVPQPEGRLDLWIMMNGPVGGLVEAVSGSDTSSPIVLAPYGNHLVSFTSTGLAGALNVYMSNVGNFSSAQGGMSFGAAALTPVAVPEPEYWLAVLMLLAGASLYWAIVYGAVLFVGKSDGDDRP